MTPISRSCLEALYLYSDTCDVGVGEVGVTLTKDPVICISAHSIDFRVYPRALAHLLVLYTVYLYLHVRQFHSSSLHQAAVIRASNFSGLSEAVQLSKLCTL